MRRRYLLVDDNAEFLENLAEILRDEGADVCLASTAKKALAFIAVESFDAVVTDMRMPGLSGAQLLHEIRARDPGLPVVLVSASCSEDQVAQARREGLLAVVSKSGRLGDLLVILSEARRDGNVVLVEGDAAVADKLCEALAARGMTAVPVHSMQELESLQVKPFATVVDIKGSGDASTDQGVERLQGRLHAKYPETPTLLFSAEPTAHLFERLDELYRHADHGP